MSTSCRWQQGRRHGLPTLRCILCSPLTRRSLSLEQGKWSSPVTMDPAFEDFLAKFSQVPHRVGTIDHPVWTGGAGPSILLMHELDGFSLPFIQLALRLSSGFRVHAPVFYGRAGESFSGLAGLGRAFFCMRKEFEVFRQGKTSQIVTWIRDLAGKIQADDPEGRRIGIIGMCMTGGIVLATIAQEPIAAGVAAQPSLPFKTPLASKKLKEDLGMGQEDLESAGSSSTPVLILRYGNDKICPVERITSIMTHIPSAILPSQQLEAKLEHIHSHATLTDRYRQETSHEVKLVSDEVIAYVTHFLAEHLGHQADGSA